MVGFQAVNLSNESTLNIGYERGVFSEVDMYKVNMRRGDRVVGIEAYKKDGMNFFVNLKLIIMGPN